MITSFLSGDVGEIKTYLEVDENDVVALVATYPEGADVIVLNEQAEKRLLNTLLARKAQRDAQEPPRRAKVGQRVQFQWTRDNYRSGTIMNLDGMNGMPGVAFDDEEPGSPVTYIEEKHLLFLTDI